VTMFSDGGIFIACMHVSFLYNASATVFLPLLIFHLKVTYRGGNGMVMIHLWQ
jgi:hypothetical protein